MDECGWESGVIGFLWEIGGDRLAAFSASLEVSASLACSLVCSLARGVADGGRLPGSLARGVADGGRLPGRLSMLGICPGSSLGRVGLGDAAGVAAAFALAFG